MATSPTSTEPKIIEEIIVALCPALMRASASMPRDRDIRIDAAIDDLASCGILPHGWTIGDLVAHYDHNVRPAHAAQAEADALEHRRRHGEPEDGRVYRAGVSDWRDRWCFAR